MVNLEKWEKGTYYSCQHQQKSKNSCDTFKQERERERDNFHRAGLGNNILHSGCEICHAALFEMETSSSADDTEKKYTIHLDSYRDSHRSEKTRSEAFVCSKCKEKYEKLALCPWCQKDKENFDSHCCRQCYYGKTPQEIALKWQEYEKAVMSSGNSPKSSQQSINISNSNDNLSTNNSPPSNSPNKSNTGLYIGLAIAGVLLVGIVVYFLVRKGKNNG